MIFWDICPLFGIYSLELMEVVKINDIMFKIKGNCFVSLLLGITCIFVMAITLMSPEKYNIFTFCYPIEYPWQFLSGIFVHGTPEFPIAASLGHLFFNLMLVFPFGILIEKVIGSNSFSVITLVVWVVQAFVFQIIAMIIVPEGESARGAGISGLAFMYGTVGIYILLRLWKNNKKLFFKQVLTYIYLDIVVVMVVMFNPFVAGVSSFPVHTIAVLLGVVITLIIRKTIDGNMEKLVSEGELIHNTSVMRFAWIIVPILLVAISMICK